MTRSRQVTIVAWALKNGVLSSIAILLSVIPSLRGEVPPFINYQGRVIVSRTNFDGNGLFKFALVDGSGGTTYWSNDGTSFGGSEPVNAVSLPVSKGLYSVRLGDSTLPNMVLLAPGVFINSDVRLRVWFNDGAHGSQLLSPDQRIGSVAYAMQADSVGDGSITAAKLSPDAISALTGPLSSQIATLTTRINSLSNPPPGAVVLPSGLTCASTDPQDPDLAANGFRLFSSIPAPAWVNGSSLLAPQARYRQAAVWSGQELITWGGTLGNGQDSGLGGRYRPDLDEWQPVSTLSSPGARSLHTAVWSGQEMIVWGGVNGGSYLNTGARFNPATQSWNPVSSQGAPSARAGHVAVWVGTQMLVWGGQNSSGLLGDGALYDPAQDHWTPALTANAPSPRLGATGLWTGSGVIIWGGEDAQGAANTGARLGFDQLGQQTTWQRTAANGPPSGRSQHAAVWTGDKMLVWGGVNSRTFLGDGGIYDPAADTWSVLSGNNALSARSGSTAIWNGQEFLIHGGETSTGTSSNGAAYNPSTGAWRALSNSGNPLARSGAAAVWSGTELIVFGGLSNGQATASLQRLSPQPAWYLFRKP